MQQKSCRDQNKQVECRNDSQHGVHASRPRTPPSARTQLCRRFKRDHGRRSENIRSAIFVGRFPFRLLANSLHKWPHTRPWITLIPKQKLYLSCKLFSTVGSLAVAQIPFQLLCSEWSQIQAGWPLKQVERRTKHESRPKQSYFFNSNFLPSKRVQLAVAPN